jgi:hypothetical protein
MAVPDSGSSTTLMGKGLNSLFKLVQLLCKVDCTDQDLVPTTALVRKGGQALRPDPFKKSDIRDIADIMIDASSQFSHTPLS